MMITIQPEALVRLDAEIVHALREECVEVNDIEPAKRLLEACAQVSRIAYGKGYNDAWLRALAEVEAAIRIVTGLDKQQQILLERIEVLREMRNNL